MKLHFHGQDYQDPYVEWQVAEGEVAGQRDPAVKRRGFL